MRNTDVLPLFNPASPKPVNPSPSPKLRWTDKYNELQDNQIENEQLENLIKQIQTHPLDGALAIVPQEQALYVELLELQHENDVKETRILEELRQMVNNTNNNELINVIV